MKPSIKLSSIEEWTEQANYYIPNARIQEFLPGGSRPDCQKTALTCFFLVLNLFYSFTEGEQWFFQRKL